jgi:hypothetical protein
MPGEDDGWVKGYAAGGKHFKKLTKSGVTPPHHEKWAEALEKALSDVTAGWSEGQTGEFTLRRRVRVSKHNPGWVDGYKIDLEPLD